MNALVSRPGFLRAVLSVDAATSGAMGLLLIGAAGLLAPMLGLPDVLLRVAGFALLPFALFVFVVARSASPAATAVWIVVALNLAWVFESAWLLAGDFVAPTALGVAFVAGQAIAVAILATLEIVGLRARRLAAS